VFQSSKSCFITLNKQRGYSSASSLNRLKSILKIKKCGFCGTLDPISQGILVVAVNKATKLISFVTDLDKVYTGKMRMGFTSSSYDTETVVKSSGVQVELQNVDLGHLEEKFTGEIEQTPPSYSALKINGKRAYELARKGETVDIKPRKVTIREIRLSVLSDDTIGFKVVCSKGTYIRSLVNDIGIETGLGAVMTELVRESVGEFNINDSVTVDELKEDVSVIDKKGLQSMDSFLTRFPMFELNEEQYIYFRNGNDISESGIKFKQGFSCLNYGGSPAFLIKNQGDVYSYHAFLRDEND
jgi:tRNA pseudouridine55 synthase